MKRKNYTYHVLIGFILVAYVFTISYDMSKEYMFLNNENTSIIISNNEENRPSNDELKDPSDLQSLAGAFMKLFDVIAKVNKLT